MSLRLAFMGSPDFAKPTLDAILAAGHSVACVYSQPPRPAGRGKAERPTPVHQLALERGLPVRTPSNFKSPEDRTAFATLELDAAVVVAYGLLLPRAILDAPRLGCFNLHGSLLPRWRGAAPIQRAVMAEDKRTGVQVMRMEAGLDTGPVLLTAETPITEDDTTKDVHDRLAELGADLMVRALSQIESGLAVETPQAEDGVVYASKITPAETRIDWTRPAGAVSAHIRGLSPAPGAWFDLPSERGPVRVKVLHARTAPGAGRPGEVLDDQLTIACGEGAVRLTRLQRAGKEPMKAEDFLRGTPVRVGMELN